MNNIVTIGLDAVFASQVQDHQEKMRDKRNKAKIAKDLKAHQAKAEKARRKADCGLLAIGACWGASVALLVAMAIQLVIG